MRKFDLFISDSVRDQLKDYQKVTGKCPSATIRSAIAQYAPLQSFERKKPKPKKILTPEDRAVLKSLCDIIGDAHGILISPHEVLKANRYMEYTSCRHLFRLYLRTKTTKPTPLEAIASIFNANHATIINSCKKAKRYLHENREWIKPRLKDAMPQEVYDRWLVWMAGDIRLIP